MRASVPGRSRRRWLRVGAMLVMGFVILLVWMVWDEPAPALDDVMPQPRVNLAAQDNLRRLTTAGYEAKGIIERWQPSERLRSAADSKGAVENAWFSGPNREYLATFFSQEFPAEELAGLVAEMEQLIEGIRPVLAENEFESPLPTSFDQNGESSPRWLGEGLQILARFHAKFGNLELADQVIKTGFRMAHCIESGRGDVVSVFTGSAVRGHSIHALAEIAKSDAVALYKAQAKKWMAMLEDARPEAAFYAEIHRVELMRSLQFLDEARQGYFMLKDEWRKVDIWGAASLVRLFLRPNETRRFYVDNARMGIRELELPMSQQTPYWKSEVELFYNDYVPRVGNIYGRRLANSTAFPHGTPSKAYLRGQTVISALQTWLAARAYHRETGRIPETLEVLVPDYMDAIPHDHRNGWPIAYDPERAAIWSLEGVDGNRLIQSRRHKSSEIVYWVIPEV